MRPKKDPFFAAYVAVLIFSFTVYLLGKHGDSVLWANSLHAPVPDFLFKWITHLGDGIFFATVTLVMLVKKWRTGLILLGMGISQALLTFILKRLVFTSQPRPRTYFEGIDQINLHFVEGVKVHAWNSFPSGHTLTAFALATFMSLYFRNRWLSFLFLMIACFAGFSRIYLAQHFLIDVCVGSMLGVGMGYLFHQWHQKLESKVKR